MRTHPEIGRQLIEKHPVPARRGPDRLLPPREVGRHGYPRGLAGRRHSARRPHLLGGRRLRRHDLRPPVLEGDLASTPRGADPRSAGTHFDPAVVATFLPCRSRSSRMPARARSTRPEGPERSDLLDRPARRHAGPCQERARPLAATAGSSAARPDPGPPDPLEQAPRLAGRDSAIVRSCGISSRLSPAMSSSGAHQQAAGKPGPAPSIPRTPRLEQDATAVSKVPARHRRRPSRVWPARGGRSRAAAAPVGGPRATDASSTTRVTSSEPSSGASSPPTSGGPRDGGARDRGPPPWSRRRRGTPRCPDPARRARARARGAARLAALAPADQCGHPGAPFLGHGGAGRIRALGPPARQGLAAAAARVVRPPAAGVRAGEAGERPAGQRRPRSGREAGARSRGPREAPAAPAEPGARIPSRASDQTEEEQH